MRIPRIYTEQSLQINHSIALEEEASQYLGRVLRTRPGDPIVLFNDTGFEFTGVIQKLSKNTVDVQITQAYSPPTESPLCITLGLVISKGDRMDFAIQKACELGTSHIWPLTSRYCDVRLDQERAEKRVAHWQKVAISASEQSGRTRVATLHPVTKLEEWLAITTADIRLVAHPGNGSALSPQRCSPATVTLLIGPEGGLHDAEITAAEAAGFLRLTLGPRILRTETAPLVAISILQHIWGDLSNV
jgi:16S rRNA (uracil1498-N3)-methyltransferase